MSHTLLTEEEVLTVLRNAENMAEIFTAHQCDFSALEREVFFESKNRIQGILSKAYGESEGV